jgi:hypothetical protein
VYYIYAFSFLIEQGVALQWESEVGYKDTVDLLLEHKANVHANQGESFLLASKNRHIDIVAMLLEHRADASARIWE